MLRMKGFVAVAGKPMRLLVQAVGPRVTATITTGLGGGRDARGRTRRDRPEGTRPRRRSPARSPDKRCTCSQTSSTTLDDIVEPVDLAPGARRYRRAVLRRQRPCRLSPPPGRSSATSCRACGSRICATCAIRCRSISGSTRVGAHAKVILVRLLGGLDWWRYGVDRLAALARERGHRAGDAAGRGPRRSARWPTPRPCRATSSTRCLRFFREGGRENLRALLRRLARHAGAPLDAAEPRPVPRAAAYLPGEGAVDLDRLAAALAPGQRRRPDHLLPLACCSRPTPRRSTRCARRLSARGLSPAPLFVTSLKDAGLRGLRARRAARGSIRR